MFFEYLCGILALLRKNMHENSKYADNTKERAEEGAPFEFTDRDGGNPSGLLYGTSGILPYVGARRFLTEND